MKWLKRKQQEITESIVETAAGALKNHSASIVQSGRKKFDKLFPTIVLGILAWEVLKSPSSAGSLTDLKDASNFTVYIGSVKVTLH